MFFLNTWASTLKVTLDFLINVDPKICIDHGKVPKTISGDWRPQNKHRPWKVTQKQATQIRIVPKKFHKNKKIQKRHEFVSNIPYFPAENIWTKLICVGSLLGP